MADIRRVKGREDAAITLSGPEAGLQPNHVSIEIERFTSYAHG
jgi:hypothetical protein